jgi:K+-transporting ATPase ATPase C chain
VNGHLRGMAWVFGLMVVLCCVLYPLLIWGIGQAAFRDQAQGSLVYGADGKAIGSRLIGQPFDGDEYFQPRPSATSPAYNASASGGSNWGASNPKLRDRVARQLGPIVRYQPRTPQEEEEGDGPLVGPDIDKWFAQHAELVTQWARDFPTLAAAWVKQDDAAGDYVKEWVKKHPEVRTAWKKDNPDAAGEPKPEDQATFFFVSFARVYPGEWPTVEDVPGPGGKTTKQVKRVKEGADVQATFFDLWLQANPGARLKPVPADMVMASGSGLDPHITYANAIYQTKRIADARAQKVIAELEKKAALKDAQRKEIVRKVRMSIDGLIETQATRPMSALPVAGEERIVNVLELNLALDRLQF